MKTLLKFRVRDQVYSIPVEQVNEILRLPNLTPIPQSEEFVAGVFNFRGKMVAAVDLGSKFGFELKEADENTCVVVLENDEPNAKNALAFIADNVDQVVDIGEDDFKPAPQIGDEKMMSFLSGMFEEDSGVCFVVDMKKSFNYENLLSRINMKDATDQIRATS